MPSSRESKSERIVLNVARRVREARLAAGLTQEAAAAQARLAYKYWQDIERGVVDLHISTLGQVARGLGVPLTQLVSVPTGRPPKRKPGRPPVPKAPQAVAKPTSAKKGGRPVR